MTQPEALLLADALGNLEATGYSSDSVSLTDRSEAIADAAADELRRLHALNGELLKALHVYQHALESGMVDQDLRSAYELAHAAIAKAEGA